MALEAGQEALVAGEVTAEVRPDVGRRRRDEVDAHLVRLVVSEDLLDLRDHALGRGSVEPHEEVHVHAARPDALEQLELARDVPRPLSAAVVQLVDADVGGLDAEGEAVEAELGQHLHAVRRHDHRVVLEVLLRPFGEGEVATV